MTIHNQHAVVVMLWEAWYEEHMWDAEYQFSPNMGMCTATSGIH